MWFNSVDTRDEKKGFIVVVNVVKIFIMVKNFIWVQKIIFRLSSLNFFNINSILLSKKILSDFTTNKTSNAITNQFHAFFKFFFLNFDLILAAYT